MQDERNVNAASAAEEAARSTSERAVRREKLANLQQAGKDPFEITKYDVSHHSTDIKASYEELEGKEVRQNSVEIKSIGKREAAPASEHSRLI